jgi:Fe2+ or Zn2+ uptake regulation protein
MMTRRTKQKEAILKVLRSNNNHPTASWIYGQVRRKMPHISLGTVYRDLKSLIKEGEISELGLAGGKRRFDGIRQNHYHFRCQQCDCILDVAEPADEELDSRVAQKTSFDVSYHRLEFYGLCPDCQPQTDRAVARSKKSIAKV